MLLLSIPYPEGCAHNATRPTGYFWEIKAADAVPAQRLEMLAAQAPEWGNGAGRQGAE
jgi:hypothetical protein